ncbi:MAG: CPBP family intramembrane metalloprotease [Kurthia sp.]|nr:CPBP family intramembrane metalloprotease [Candidatus Kurthia equi]
MNVKKTPLYILITYIVMQLSSILVVLPVSTIIKALYADAPKEELSNHIAGWTTFTSFLLGFLVTLFFIMRDKDFLKKAFIGGKKATTPTAIVWGILGFVIVLCAQMLAGYVEQKLGVTGGSENTASLSSIAAVSPIIIISIVLIGPFLEEVVFRRIIFGSLNQTTNFFIAAIVSAIMFGLVHMDFSHILTYVMTGLAFAFLYNKTHRLLTTIIAHILLNGFVIYINLNHEKILDVIEKIQKAIGQ